MPDGPRRASPPDGITEQHHVVVGKAVGHRLGKGDVLQGLIVMLAADTAIAVRIVEVICLIRLLGHNLEQVGAQLVGNRLSHGASVARAAKVGDQHVSINLRRRQVLRAGFLVCLAAADVGREHTASGQREPRRN